jgi:hypothetical protein
MMLRRLDDCEEEAGPILFSPAFLRSIPVLNCALAGTTVYG